jgi:hypothetical protein
MVQLARLHAHRLPVDWGRSDSHTNQGNELADRNAGDDAYQPSEPPLTSLHVHSGTPCALMRRKECDQIVHVM